MRRPKNRNGHLLYLQFHTSGYCIQGCRYFSSHGTLNAQEEMGILAAIRQAREIRASHQKRIHRLGDTHASEGAAPAGGNSATTGGNHQPNNNDGELARPIP